MVELSAHHIMSMPCQDIDAVPGLVVPDPHSLVITGSQDPRELPVEHSCPDVIDMSWINTYLPFSVKRHFLCL